MIKSGARNTLYTLILTALLISGCGPGQLFGPTITVTPSPTETVTPSPSPTSTQTPSPTNTPTATPEVTLAPWSTPELPSEIPLKIWKGLPIMPGALAGKETAPDRMYYFITKASQDEVKDYYLEVLPDYGWVSDLILPNDESGYIVYRDCCFDFLYIYESIGFTHVQIWYKGK